MHSQLNVVRKFEHGPLAYLLKAPKPKSVANDNGETLVSDDMLEAALRFFAEHGLGAARAARHNAEQAFFDGESDKYRYWLTICRVLDKRMAMISSHKLEASTTPA